MVGGEGEMDAGGGGKERVNLVFRIKIAVDNPEGILKPGMPADADID